jgi:hypothetical protein
MYGETITLVIYGGVAFILAFGGIYTLRKGFQLITNSRGKPAEKNTIKFLGLHVTTGSIGALVMITAFMWGWAAKLSLPQYQDGNITTADLKKQLAVVTTKADKLTAENTIQNKQLAVITKKANKLADENITQSKQLSSLKSNIKQYVATSEANEKRMNSLFSKGRSDHLNLVWNNDEKNILREYNLNKDKLKKYKTKMKF